MATNAEMLKYFWEEKGDPTRYTGWDEEKYPEIAAAYKEYLKKVRMYASEVTQTLDRAIDNEEPQ